MNQTVEAIYAEMFAPHAIPIEVINLYDKINFFVKKEGLPGMRKFDMCMIAGIALNKPVKLTEKTKRDEQDIVDTSEDFDIDNPVESAQMIIDDETSTFEDSPTDDLPAPPDNGKKMDAPKAPDPNNKRKGNLETLLGRMTKDELLAHATGICGVSVNKLAGRQRGKASKAEIDKIGKQKIIKAILESSK